ncbi:PREDICTED: uncharacterized protein LOC109116394 [Tarenaya hassleriana]|uniref:uncharacterized protein LOC109116394 n=1 Tax=Tarenaya hassleriana TaxID=28532 RepID=UPI0008FD3064|nr:PREDICTED: uncharacterized protein LOC109116394 [Tarenaya hassleriana]
MAFTRFHAVQKYTLAIDPEARGLAIGLQMLIVRYRNGHVESDTYGGFRLSSPEIVGEKREELFGFLHRSGLDTVGAESIRGCLSGLALEALSTEPGDLRGVLTLLTEVYVITDRFVDDSRVRIINRHGRTRVRHSWRFGDELYRNIQRTIVVEHRTPRVFRGEPDEDETDSMTQLAIQESFDEIRPQVRPVCESAIDSLKETTAKERGIGEGDGCAICLEDFVAEKKSAALPCRHEFHSECIVRWLRINHVCPLCRFRLPRATGRNSER